MGNTEVVSSVTTLVTTSAAPVVARGEVAKLVSTESPSSANDPDRRAAALHLSPCGQCTMGRTSGAAKPGYCIGRDHLPLAYGLLHALPGDLGDGCPEYRPPWRT